jgi:hypothetical protein
MLSVLIPYGTTEGLTAKISEFVADVIRGHDHKATVVDIKGSRVPKLEGYDAVIVGASIHMGKHEDHVLDFVRENRDALERLPSAFFSVSMAAPHGAHGELTLAAGSVLRDTARFQWGLKERRRSRGSSNGSGQRMRTWKATMARTERVTTIATRLPDSSSRASGMSSEKTIQIMAPAANPSPYGNNGLKVSTNTKAGTAINGCGRLENTLQKAARLHATPRGTSTRLMARPSGML